MAFLKGTIQAAAAVFGLAFTAQQLPAVTVCTPVSTHSGGEYNYAICNVPDLDQVRVNIEPFNTGLPGDGWMYCVPTSMMNWFVYLANHGAPALKPGPGNYGPEQCAGVGDCTQYNKITAALRQLGSLMNTSTKKGTSTTGALEGGRTWLRQNGLSEKVTLSAWTAHPGSAAPSRSMARAGVLGKLVMPVIGRYKKWDDLTKKQRDDVRKFYPTADTYGYWRVGGHVVSLAVAQTGLNVPFYIGPTDYLGFRDPASPQDNGTTQSPFETTFTWGRQFEDVYGAERKTLTNVDAYGDNFYLDGYISLDPAFALTGDKNAFWYFTALRFADVEPTVKLQKFITATGGAITEIATEPHLHLHTYLTADNSGIFQLDPLTGESRRLANVPGAKKMMYGSYDATLYVMTAHELLALSPSGEVRRRVLTRTPLDGFAYDFKNKHIVGISLAGQKMYSFSDTLEPLREASFQSPICTTSYHFKFNPNNASFAGLCDGSVRVSFFDWTGESVRQTQTVLAGLTSPTGLSFNDAGRMFVADSGKLREFDQTGRPMENAIFPNMPANGPVDVSRAFFSYNPKTIDTFQEDNIPALELPTVRPIRQ